jgi:type III restriction enzyme
MNSEQVILEKMITDYVKLGNNLPEIPDYIVNNLNSKFELRPYQIEAFARFLYYFDNEFIRKYPTQVLFHMATGSGKTLIMAGLILELYMRGYRNFLFFVHSNNIIMKTKENFLNSASLKYLFADSIAFGNKKVKIRELNNFQINEVTNDINIVFSTIQGLHFQLTEPKENGLSYDDFIDNKIVLISDECHHLNIDTRKGGTREEKEVNFSWETVINNILHKNKDNVLLEFTATADLKNPYIGEKYADKLIIDYPLLKFREDGYSKEVKTLQSDIPLMQRAIQAILLNQYRLKLFQDHKLDIKPVILFKAVTKEQSKNFMFEFLKTISELTPKYLSDLRDSNGVSDNILLSSMYDYFESQNISLEILVQELKNDFSFDHCISMNDENDMAKIQIEVNELEKKSNPYRAIFQVRKLDEGWDVLNLFDIVRLYETRDSKAGKPGKTTIAEAQLIGRGARYCPFVIDEFQNKYKRKYDNDLTELLRICETLYYHCQYDSKYITELTKALIETGIVANNIVERDYKLKDDFKNDDFYKHGLVFFNGLVKIVRKDVFTLSVDITEKEHIINNFTGRIADYGFFGDTVSSYGEINIFPIRKTIGEISESYYSIMHKALRQYDMFNFNNLKIYYPNLSSIREFIISPQYLGNVNLLINSPMRNLDADILYQSCENITEKLVKSMIKVEQRYEGTKEFEGESICKVFKDVQRVSYANPHGYGNGIPQSAFEMSNDLKIDLSKEPWYVYNDNYGTTEEKSFIKYFKTYVDELYKVYDKVYVIRNEKRIKIYSFEKGEAFQPDYIVFLRKNGSEKYEQLQIFVEPKGSHLLTSEDEKWKENMMLSLESESIPVVNFVDDNDYRILGFHFYNREHRQMEFKRDIERLLDVGDLHEVPI